VLPSVLPHIAAGTNHRLSAKRIQGMIALFQLIGGLAGIGSLICFIMVLVKMFQNGQTGLGVACIVLIFLCGIGGLIAFIMGWINVDRWRIRNVMLAWTGCIIVGILCNIVVISTVGFHLPAGVPAH
jgi:hypothetical protein